MVLDEWRHLMIEYDHEGGRYDQIYDQINRKTNATTWSPTSTKTFLGCRLRYFFQYVKNWRITVRSPAFSIGTSFHAAAEKLNVLEALDKDIDTADLFEEFDRVWLSEIKDMKEGVEYKDQSELDVSRQKGLDLLEKHVDSTIRKSYKPLLYTPPFSDVQTPAVEVRVDVPLVNLYTGTPYTDKHRVTGFVDAMAVAHRATSHFDPGDLMVLDYKTSSREWNQFTVDTNIQLLMYAYAIRFILRNENWFPGLNKTQEDLVGIVCLIKQKPSGTDKWGKIKNYIIRITDDEIQYLERMLLKCVADLEASGTEVEGFLPNPTPDNCRYCEYQEPCLLVRRGARNQDIIDWGESKGFRS
jgi:hypothetical protein